VTKLQVYSNVANLKLVIAKPGKIWSAKTNAWEDMPADGNPTQDHLIDSQTFAPIGKLSRAREFSLPIDPAVINGAGFCLFSLDNDGKPGDLIDVFPWQYSEPVVIGHGRAYYARN